MATRKTRQEGKIVSMENKFPSPQLFQFGSLCFSRSGHRHCSEEMLLRNLLDYELHNIFKSFAALLQVIFFLFGVNGCLLYPYMCILQSIGNIKISPAFANFTHITCRWRAKRVVVGLCSAAFLFCGMFHPFLRRNYIKFVFIFLLSSSITIVIWLLLPVGSDLILHF
jgi:hypothetical protein